MSVYRVFGGPAERLGHNDRSREPDLARPLYCMRNGTRSVPERNQK